MEFEIGNLYLGTRAGENFFTIQAFPFCLQIFNFDGLQIVIGISIIEFTFKLKISSFIWSN